MHSGDLLKLYLLDWSLANLLRRKLNGHCIFFLSRVLLPVGLKFLANLLRSKLNGHCIFCLSRVLLPVGLKFLDRGFILQLGVKKIATSKVISDFGIEVYVSLTGLFPIDVLRTKDMIGV